MASDPADPAGASGRLDRVLVQRGLSRSRAQAVALIADGAVLVDGAVITRSATAVRVGQQVEVVRPDHYVSRAAHKLLGALEDCRPRLGASALDAGASTGGFTQVLLEQGVDRVVAVDVGHDQLHPSLRADRRVVVRERLHLRDLGLDDLEGEPVDLVVADVSFISITKVLAPLAAVTKSTGQMLIMVKPQFEVGREQLAARRGGTRDGVVVDPQLQRQAVHDVVEHAAGLGWGMISEAPSRLPGPAGNREFFVLFEQTRPLC